MKTKYNILIIDDEEAFLSLLIEGLKESNKFKVDICTQLSDLDNVLKSNTYDFALLDIMLEPRLTIELISSNTDYDCQSAGIDIGIPKLLKNKIPFCIFTNCAKDTLKEKSLLLVGDLPYLIKKEWPAKKLQEYLFKTLSEK